MKYPLLFACIFCCRLAIAQSDMHFQYTVLNNKNGLNTNNINDCIRDKRGFLWMATDFGITRYSGQNSIHFSMVEQTGKSIGPLTKLLVTDSIIYASGSAGLYEINPNTCSISKVDLKGDVFINDMVFYRDWIILGSKEGSLLFFQPCTRKVDIIKLDGGIPINLLVHRDKLFTLMLYKGGCTIYNLITRRVSNVIRISPIYYSDKLLLSKSREVLLCNKDLIRRFDEQKNAFVPYSTYTMVTAYKEMAEDQVFFVKDFHKFFVQKQNEPPLQLYPPVDKSAEFKKIKGDLNNDLYLVSNHGVIIIRKYIPFTILNVFKDNEVHVQRAIYEDTLRKQILFFAYDKLSVYDQQLKTFTPRSCLLTTHAVTPFQHKLLLATEASTLYDLDLTTYTNRKLFRNENPALQFLSVAHTSSGTYLLGSMDGLFQIKEPFDGIKPVSLIYQGKDYSKMVIKAIWVQKDQIWIGGNLGILVLNQNFQVIKRYARNAGATASLPNDEVNCFYATKLGMYVGLDGELAFIPFDGSSVKFYYSSVYGRSTNRIVSIVEDAFQDIWFATFRGVYRLNPLNGSIRGFHAPLYFTNDEFNRSSSLSARSGKLYFGNIAEFVEIDPSLYRDSISPSLFQFNAAKIYSQDKQLIKYDLKDFDKIEFPLEGSSLDISYLLTDPVNLDQVSYQYRLVKFNDEWIDLGNKTALQLFSLSGGEHHLQIRAVGTGVIGSTILNLTLVVPVVFYKTIWFYIVWIIILLLLGFIFYFIRVRNLQRMIQFRKEISNELHDTVGTTVTKSIYTAQSLLQEKKDDERVQRIIDYGRQINANFRDVLWSMEKKTDAIINLFDRISEIGNQAVANTNFDFQMIKENISADHALSVRQKRDLLMITREAIHNALKHSNGNLISFHFSVKDKKLHVKISDNGTNANTEISYSGMGLESMKLRAQKMGATSISFKKQEQGFEVYLIV